MIACRANKIIFGWWLGWISFREVKIRATATTAHKRRYTEWNHRKNVRWKSKWILYIVEWIQYNTVRWGCAVVWLFTTLIYSTENQHLAIRVIFVLVGDSHDTFSWQHYQFSCPSHIAHYGCTYWLVLTFRRTFCGQINLWRLLQPECFFFIKFMFLLPR